MRNCRFLGIAAAASLFFLASCSHPARIEGVLTGAPASEVVVKLLDVNRYQILDTVATDAAGRYKYKVDVAQGQPEFIYLFYKDTKVASLLLQAGDKVQVTSDTLGTYSVTGSDETLKLMEVEKDEAEFSNRLLASSARLQDLEPSSGEAAALRKKMSQDYVDYYRGRVKYVLTNSHSLTSIPVLYQVVGENLQVFGQLTDAIHFKNICDSLKTVYPESKYVKALQKEAARRQQLLSLSSRLNSAEETAYPELDLTDVNGAKVKLSSVDAKVVMIYFWSSADAAQTLFNTDVMMPVYRDYHPKGLEIYSVSIDTDKASWASVVRNQKLPWINVCDGRGTSSPAVATYNVQALPVSYFIVDGRLTASPEVKDEASLRKFLASKL
ncbi:MAG: thioredoxin-like domain-containing protein [Bacteroidales bacterium]|nr:thioredoxin-like domain-containing protein [Bacteroidales bacterium]